MNYIKTRKISDLILGAVTLGFGICLYISARSITTGTALQQGGDHMPKVVGIFLIILGICQLIFASHKTEKADVQTEDQMSMREKTIQGLKEFAVLFLYIFFLKKIGFIIMTVLFVFAQSLLITPKVKINYVRIGIISVLTSVLTYMVFVHGFNLMLPAGILG